jgi:large subunit ribosomal protein L4e
MKAHIFDKSGKKAGEIELPSQFETPIRKDLISRAVIAIRKNKVQPHGSKKQAGSTSSAKFRGRRSVYGHSYGIGIARVPRLMIRGGRRVGRAMNSPQVVGGPRAHPPVIERVWDVKMNSKERRMAIRSALAATVSRELVAKRGHVVPENFPVIVTADFENLSKTKEVLEVFEKLGLSGDLERASKKKIRSGLGKARGRPYNRAKGPLVVIGGISPVIKAASNIAGVDVITVNSLNAESLAPGTHPGRLTVYTESALKRMREEKLFL